MHFLVSNDDGYKSPGLQQLVGILRQQGKVTVVAPERNRSGSSNSLTLDVPLRVQCDEPGVFYLNGTPTDCIHLALTELLDEKPDVVISGINFGANLGDDVLYSGTVAAAMEGRFLDCPAIALSLAVIDGRTKVDYGPAITAIRPVLARLINNDDFRQSNCLLNINVPDTSAEHIAGYEITRLGKRDTPGCARVDYDARGKVYWIGTVGEPLEAGPGTDFHAVQKNKISITPLQIDCTHYAMLDRASHFLSKS